MSFVGTTASSDAKGDRKLPIKVSRTDDDVSRTETTLAAVSGISRKTTPSGVGTSGENRDSDKNVGLTP